MAGVITPYKNTANYYSGVGSGVLKPGTIVAPGGYKGPQSILGTSTGTGVYESTGQPAYTPPTNTGNNTGGYADPEAAARAAQDAADAAKRNELKTQATGLLQNLMGAYDSLFGSVRSAAKSQNDVLDKRYNQEVTGLTDQFNQELPKVGRAYASRGTYDSSYRGDAEQQATTGFNNQIADIGTQREADAAKIGQFVAEKEGMVNAEKGLLAKMLGDLPNVNDLNELTQLKQSIDRKIADVQSAQAGTQSQEAYSAKLGEIAPSADRMAALQSTLTNIVNGAAPGALKKAVAQQVIGSSGLTEEQQRQLLGEVNSQIA
jgi:hypothetical protein